MAETGSQPDGNQNNQLNRKHHHRQAKWAQNPRKRRRGPAQQNHFRTAAVVPTPICCICTDPDKTPSYKCPKCRALYCSVVCCKEHKTICAGKLPDELPTCKNAGSPVLANLAPLSSSTRNRKRGLVGNEDEDEDSLDDSWKLTDEMKLAVEQSEWLRKQLQDGGLRGLIRESVESGSVECLRQVQQRYPHFQVFLDKLLLVAGVLEREKDMDDVTEPLDEWLERDWSQNSSAPPQLSLTPLRRKIPTFKPVDVSSSSSYAEDDASSSEEDASDAIADAKGTTHCDFTKDEQNNGGEA